MNEKQKEHLRKKIESNNHEITKIDGIIEKINTNASNLSIIEFEDIKKYLALYKEKLIDSNFVNHLRISH